MTEAGEYGRSLLFLGASRLTSARVTRHRDTVPRDLPSTPPSRTNGDALSALLDTEKALRERLDSAAAEAEGILGEARVKAADAERELETAAVRELAALESSRAKALQDELAVIATRSRADRARFEGVSDARIKELAARVVALVLRA